MEYDIPIMEFPPSEIDCRIISSTATCIEFLIFSEYPLAYVPKVLVMLASK